MRKGFSFVVSLLGIWLIFAPSTFFFRETALVYSDWISGALLFFLGIWGRKSQRGFFVWITVFIGLWLQMAPLLFWVKDPASYLNDTLIGALVIAFSLIFREESEDIGTIPPGFIPFIRNNV